MKNELENQEKGLEIESVAKAPFWKSNIFWITYPIWGTMITMGLVGWFDKHFIANVFFIIGLLFLPFSLMPIVKKHTSKIDIIVMCILYILGMVIPVFALGWMSLCLFQPNCH